MQNVEEHGADGSIEKYKAIFISKGFSQKEGVDYDETFSLMAQYTLEEISTQNGPFNPNSNSMSSCVSQLNSFKFEINYRS